MYYFRMADCKDDLCLKWSEFESNLTKTFDQLRRSQDFVDVTLNVGGNSIKCHKVLIKYLKSNIVKNTLILFEMTGLCKYIETLL